MLSGHSSALMPPRVLSADGRRPPLSRCDSRSLTRLFARSHSGAYTPLKDILESTLERAPRIVDWDLDDKACPELMQGLRELGPADGVEAELDQLDQAGWERIAVTNPSRELADALLAHSGLATHFEIFLLRRWRPTASAPLANSWRTLGDQMISKGVDAPC